MSCRVFSTPGSPTGEIMSDTPYPVPSVRALLPTEWVTPATRHALTERLKPLPDAPPRCFTPAQFDAAAALLAIMLPVRESPSPRKIASMIDARLHDTQGDGWRYDGCPPDETLYKEALDRLNSMAQISAGRPLNEMDAAAQKTLVRVVRDAANANSVAGLYLFFEEFFAEAMQYYASHPLTQEEIGYAGMADGRAWKDIGLNQREDREPEAGAAVFAVPNVPPKPDLLPFERPEMRTYPTDDTVDAVVIGTGAGGAPVLARLAQAGLKVVALEAGNFWNPETDFATDEHAQLKLYWMDERLSAGADPIQFGNNNSGVGVGGTTLHYTAYTPRAQPDDLRLHTEFGVGADWPIEHAELARYYDELETFLGVSGPNPYPWGPERNGRYPLPPLPLNSAAQLMERACAGLNIRTSPAPNAAVSQAYYQKGVGWRPACTNRGLCQAGCNNRAKGSVDVTFIPLAIGAGAEVRANSFVTRIETNRAGEVSGVVYVRNGVEIRQKCRHLFLCAGAIETPRLLLMNGLANSSGQVGKNFMAHCGLQVWGEFAEETRPHKGIPGGLISEDTHRPKDADFAGGYLLQSIGVMPVTYATQWARGIGNWGAEAAARLLKYNHVAGINILGDCLPQECNFLELSDELDGRGLPKPRIHFSAGENEKRMTAHADGIMRRIWEAAGAENVWTYNRFAHTIGTCRMGNNPAASVVNPDGRAHDVPNLTILDNSVFPSALSVNPALTIMALALRGADRYLDGLRRGD